VAGATRLGADVGGLRTPAACRPRWTRWLVYTLGGAEQGAGASHTTRARPSARDLGRRHWCLVRAGTAFGEGEQRMPLIAVSRRDALILAVRALQQRLGGAAAIVLACFACGCGGAKDPAAASHSQPIGDKAKPPGSKWAPGAAQARVVAQAYLDALARGDGKTACRLVSPRVISDTGEYPSRAACTRDLKSRARDRPLPDRQGRDAIADAGHRDRRCPAVLRHGLRQPTRAALRRPLDARRNVTTSAMSDRGSAFATRSRLVRCRVAVQRAGRLAASQSHASDAQAATAKNARFPQLRHTERLTEEILIIAARRCCPAATPAPSCASSHITAGWGAS
jgi:hypothetical protein